MSAKPIKFNPESLMTDAEMGLYYVEIGSGGHVNQKESVGIFERVFRWIFSTFGLVGSTLNKCLRCSLRCLGDAVYLNHPLNEEWGAYNWDNKGVSPENLDIIKSIVKVSEIPEKMRIVSPAIERSSVAETSVSAVVPEEARDGSISGDSTIPKEEGSEERAGSSPSMPLSGDDGDDFVVSTPVDSADVKIDPKYCQPVNVISEEDRGLISELSQTSIWYILGHFKQLEERAGALNKYNPFTLLVYVLTTKDKEIFKKAKAVLENRITKVFAMRTIAAFAESFVKDDRLSATMATFAQELHKYGLPEGQMMEYFIIGTAEPLKETAEILKDLIVNLFSGDYFSKKPRDLGG